MNLGHAREVLLSCSPSSLYLAFYVSAGDQIQVLMIVQQVLLRDAPFPKFLDKLGK